MKLLGRSGTSGEPGEVRRVTGYPGAAVQSVDADTPADSGTTPVPSRLRRLAAAVDGVRRGRTDRNVRKIMQIVGMLAMVLGFVAIIVGWYGAAHSPYLYQEVPYLISGGLLGVALVIGGGVLVRCAWSLRQVEEDRRNALAIVRSIDRLERILRGVNQNGVTESRQQQEEQV
jgi:hypothetical protein